MFIKWASEANERRKHRSHPLSERNEFAVTTFAARRPDVSHRWVRRADILNGSNFLTIDYVNNATNKHGGLYVSSSDNRADCYADLGVSSLPFRAPNTALYK